MPAVDYGTSSGGTVSRCTSSNLAEVVVSGWYPSQLCASQVSVAAAAGFLLYGGRLFIMLRRFPIESRGRRKKLREVIIPCAA